MWRASIYTCTASSTESSFWVSRWLYSILPCIRANNTVDRAYGGISAGYRDYTRGVYWSACPVWTLECWISLPRFLAQRRKTVRGDRIGIGCCVLNAYCLCVGLCFCIELCVFPHRRVPLIFVSIIQLIGFIKTASGVSISISPTHSHTLVYLPPCENEHVELERFCAMFCRPQTGIAVVCTTRSEAIVITFYSINSQYFLYWNAYPVNRLRCVPTAWRQSTRTKFGRVTVRVRSDEG